MAGRRHSPLPPTLLQQTAFLYLVGWTQASEPPLCYSTNREVEEGCKRDFKGSQFKREIILWGVRWYVAYPISYRQLEEMMDDRG